MTQATTRAYELRDTLLSIKDICLSFGDKPVLNGVNAEVRDIVRPGCTQGQVVAILGPSGVGKTQLSRILAGLQTATSGTATIGANATPVRAGLVGYVPQNYPLLRHRTVLSNLTLAAQSAGASAAEAKEKSYEFLKRFDLSDKWDAYPAELSGGQRQRIAIAQQLLCSEHYLILDEPTTGLDPIMKDKVCDFVRQVSCISEENTVFLVSHDVPVTLSLADHLWLMGRVRDETGKSLGARVVQQYDLIERGIAWHERPSDLPQFNDLLREIRDKFNTL
jgi:polar amino acid transport system ATP-binding protein/sulfate transport system ATP-binding protein